jgi:hypothetical protein
VKSAETMLPCSVRVKHTRARSCAERADREESVGADRRRNEIGRERGRGLPRRGDAGEGAPPVEDARPPNLN